MAALRRAAEPHVGPLPVESITTEDIERWKGTLIATGGISNPTLQKYLVTHNGIFKRAMRVWRLPRNPEAEAERPRLARPGAIDVFSTEEVHAHNPKADAARRLLEAFSAGATVASSVEPDVPIDVK